jgi:hypothetical protein
VTYTYVGAGIYSEKINNTKKFPAHTQRGLEPHARNVNVRFKLFHYRE